MRQDLRSFKTRGAAAVALADALSLCLREALNVRGRAVLVASGGSSPEATYRHLAKQDLDWPRISILPSDERCVPSASPRHNLGMIRRSLDVKARFVELTESASSDAEDNSSPDIHADLLPFDAVLLGMGEDGHTASLFPTDPNITSALVSKSNLHFCAPPGVAEARVSLTPRALLNARAIFLLIYGAAKRTGFASAMAEGTESASPVRILLRTQAPPVQVFWAP